MEQPLNPESNPESNPEKNDFLYPMGRYRGEFTLENVTFNANLQEFAQKVGFVCNLETGGKLTSDQAYDEIKKLWKSLKTSKKNLLDRAPLPPPELPSDGDMPEPGE